MSAMFLDCFGDHSIKGDVKPQVFYSGKACGFLFLQVVKGSAVDSPILPQEELHMQNPVILSANSTKSLAQNVVAEELVTTKELAQMLGVDKRTIQNVISDKGYEIHFAPFQTRGGVQQMACVTKAQATAIKIELQNHSKIAKNGFDTLRVSNDLEMMLVQKKLTEYQNMRIRELTAERDAYKNCLDDMTSAKGMYSLKSVAKILEIKPQAFNRELIRIGFCIDNAEHEIMQDKKDRGYGTFVIPKNPSPDGKYHASTKITGKGIVWIAKQLKIEPNAQLLEQLAENA